MNRSLRSIASSVALFLLTSASAWAEETYELDIADQELSSALKEFAEQSGLQVVYFADLANDKRAKGVHGTYSADGALSELLDDTELTYSTVDDRTYSIAASAAAADEGGDSDSGNGTAAGATPIVMVQNRTTQPQRRSASAEDDDSDRAAVLEEIIVTASRRAQVLQDVPMSISAISSDTIEKRGLVGMDDYLRSLPSVNFMDRGAGRNQIAIRGLVADPQSGDSTAGVYFGETPISDLGSPSNDGSAGNADIKLVDIERIEVLRGPQGTLYGAGSMGGTVKVVPVSPDLENLEGRIASRYSATSEDGGNNSMLQGVLNVPLVEGKLAMRGLGYRFDNSGYIRNVAATQPILGIPSSTPLGGVAENRDDVGGDQYTGFRLAALWQPTDSFDVTYTYTGQEIEQDGAPEVNTSLTGDFEQARLNTGPGGSNYEFLTTDIGINNLGINYDLGWGVLTSASSWIDYQAALEADISHLLFAPYYAPNSYEQDVFVQEFRFTSQLDARFQFLAGVYYESNERLFLGSWSWSGDPSLDTGDFLENEVHDDKEQLSFYGELSYDLSDALKVTVGARHFDYDRTRLQDASILGSKVIDNVFIAKNENGETFKINLAWSLTDNILAYGEWSEGFRMGQPATSPNPLCDADNDGILDDVGFRTPDGIDSDTTDNYELGLKASAFNGRMTINTAVYHIDWKGIPVIVPLPSCSDAVFVNAGESKSEGIELEFHVRLWNDMQLDLGASFGEAALTQDAPGIGSDGDNLPGSPDREFNVGLHYAFEVAGRDAFARIDYAHVSEYYHTVDESGQASGGYGEVHLKTGITFERVNLDIFVNNLTNASDFTWVEGGWLVNRAYRLRPRTVGLNLGYRF